MTLRFRGLEVVLQVFNRALLILLTVVQAGQQRDEILYLLLFKYQVAREFVQARGEFVFGQRVNWRIESASRIVIPETMPAHTFIRSLLLLYIANFVIRAERLQIVSSVDKVQRGDELLRELIGVVNGPPSGA